MPPRLRSIPSCTGTSGKMSCTTSTKGAPRRAATQAPIWPIGGGSVMATTTSGRGTDSAPANEFRRYVA
jgi:hypothetical protein